MIFILHSVHQMFASDRMIFFLLLLSMMLLCMQCDFSFECRITNEFFFCNEFLHLHKISYKIACRLILILIKIYSHPASETETFKKSPLFISFSFHFRWCLIFFFLRQKPNLSKYSMPYKKQNDKSRISKSDIKRQLKHSILTLIRDIRLR